MNRPENPDLKRAEWVNLITAVVLEIGEENAKGILRRAIGDERANLLIEKQEGPRLSKDDNRAIVKEMYDYVPGSTREEKVEWAIRIGKQVFGSGERFSEILDYVEHRVAEHEEAGGTIDKMPTQPDAPITITGTQLGFVWKPVSEHGRLVVLLPTEFTHKTSRRMLLRAADGHEQWSNRAHDSATQPNGNREHYRFRRQGGNYAGPVTLSIEAEGIDWYWTIPDPARRYDNLLPSIEHEVRDVD